jgi:hypothetical protein
MSTYWYLLNDANKGAVPLKRHAVPLDLSNEAHHPPMSLAL